MKLRPITYVAVLMLLLSSHAVATPKTQTPAELFDFHSGFWINLHHSLYRQAQVSSGNQRVTITKEDAGELAKLSPEERSAWDSAVAYYSASVIDRDLLFDRELIGVKNALEDEESSAHLAGASIPTDMKAILLKAAPVYRKHWWTRHNVINRQWIAKLKKLVDQYGAEMSADLVKIYGEPWPGNPVRVDAVMYANWAGAYTTLHPTRPTIAASDPANQDVAALEIVFHETSHGMMDKVLEAIEAAETKVNAGRGAKFDSGQLWHAVLFYTAGELVADRIPGYVPYAGKNGLWSRAWHESDRTLIEKDWKPHITGTATLTDAVDKLIADEAEQAQKAR